MRTFHAPFEEKLAALGYPADEAGYPKMPALHYYVQNGRFYFPVQSEIEQVLLEQNQDSGSVYQRPAVLNNTEFVWDDAESAWYLQSTKQP